MLSREVYSSLEIYDFGGKFFHLGTASKPIRLLTGGSVHFWAVSLILNIDSWTESPALAG